MRIVDLLPDDESIIQQVAALLVEGFAAHYPTAWPTLGSALEEVRESFGEGHISRVALDEDGSVLGWIGGIRVYHGFVWELHPLVVKMQQQGKGVGRALVLDFEERVRERGGPTILLGTDDEDHQTTLSDVNLYPNV